jgi:TetR/AcrR family transcriptional repressor of bet genes
MTRRTFHREPEAVRQNDLIAATLDSVAELGLAGATVREVANRAGVTPGLIRRYFDNKERLVSRRLPDIHRRPDRNGRRRVR